MNKLTHTPTGARRKLLTLGAVVIGASLLASCSSLIGPRQVEIPLHKLQAGLDRRFPINERLLELFDVQLTRPQLALQPEQDRVALNVDASVAPPFARAWTGSVAFSGRLYVDPGRAAVMMAEPRVERLQLGNPEAERRLTSVANGLIDSVARDLPVYTFDQNDLRYAGVQFVPTRIQTTRTGLLVSLEPAK
ncbi:DUF1439 domain-containing protein [Massilia sp. YIM B02443]|uniref:DUF1439 domain-containing protein n=1 Tax=Massilia sp. YIM B02443 TaxID=3050127 RepID=UPI0025B67C91|nr:DUF1439 domain-containing protein [Massilia sp. YIM B02443]MDN4038809.1 DUF1439 domain-containing protein [Massilia sp. YIM B02443]